MFTGVFVDLKEEDKLPSHIRKAARKNGTTYPYVVLTDPALKKVYGSYSYPQLKSLKFYKIFKQAKLDAKADIESDNFALTADSSGYSGNKTSASDEEKNTRIEIEDPEFRIWQSAKGSEIDAKLIAIEGEFLFVFQTRKGKTIRTTANKLSEDTVREARELAGL